ncbi:hypothetical protein [Nocardia rosealba]|uniref:hypothetical protein n=1 Tax=Nocardia rosealba TaxID=2878563 RepID=UPI001CDA0AC7|nr:hypothetical protein [Nocardia rosealba]MCA2206080.1 hypothetical protein [Nocardia rosealba]
MRSSNYRKEPDPWVLSAAQARRSIVSIMGMVVLVVGPAVLGVVMWRSGDPTAVSVAKYVVIFAAAMFCLLIMASAPYLSIVFRNKPQLRQSGGVVVTVLPGSKIYFWAFQATWLCFALLFLPAAYQVADAGFGQYWHLVVIFGGIGAFATIPVVLSLIGAMRPDDVLLTPEVIIHEGWNSRTQLLWDDVNRVRTSFERLPIIDIAGMVGARWLHRYRIPYSTIMGRSNPAWNLDRPPHTGWIVLECPRFALEKSSLYRYLQFYAENPESRTELGTPTSLARWATLADDVSA